MISLLVASAVEAENEGPIGMPWWNDRRNSSR